MKNVHTNNVKFSKSTFKYMKVFGLILVFMECYIHIRASCEESDFCSNEKRQEVGACIRDEREKGHCNTSMFQSYFRFTDLDSCQPKEKCKTEEINYCQENPCKNGGVCNRMFGSYWCSCTGSYHGRNCADAGGTIDTVKDIYIIFNIATKPGRDLCTLLIGETGDDMLIVFSPGSGENLYLEKDKLKAGAVKCPKNNPNCPYLPKKAMKYVRFKFDVFYQLDDTVITEHYPTASFPGFRINTINLKIYNGDDEEFSQDFDQLVSYREAKCPRELVFPHNCGKSIEDPYKFSRKTYKVIESVMKMNKEIEMECQNPVLNFVWIVSTAGVASPVITEKGEDKRVLYIEKYSLDIAIYIVDLIVDVSGLRGTQKEGYNASYAGKCFFEVVQVPLVAIIEGSSVRKEDISQSKLLILDGSQSHDPNERQDRQSHLRWTWSCNDSFAFCTSHAASRSPIFEVPLKGLNEGQILYFTLTVVTTDGSNEPANTTQKIVLTKSPQIHVEVMCLKNCGAGDFKTNPKERVYLKVNNGHDLKELQWDFSENGSTDQSGKTISQDIIESDVFIIRENTLNPGSKYTFVVSGSTLNGTRISGSMDLLVNKPPRGGLCNITPGEGQKALTQFHISCTNFTVDDDNPQLSYEYYQSSTQDGHRTILGLSTSGELKNVILTDMFVSIRVADVYGIFTDISIQVALLDRNVTSQNVWEMLKTLTSLASSGDRAGVAQMAGAIAEVMENVRDKQTLFNNVLKVLGRKLVNDYFDAKLFASALKKVVEKGVPLLENGIDSSNVQTIGRLMSFLSRRILYDIRREEKYESIILESEIKEIAMTMLDCTDTIINSKDKTDKTASKGNRDMFLTHGRYKKGTASMVATLDYVGIAVLTKLLPHEEEIVLKTDETLMWLKVESPQDLANLSGIPQNSNTRVEMSTKLGNSLGKTTQNIAIKVTTFNKNPYWWDLEDRNIASEIISISMWEMPQSSMNLVTNVFEPLDIYLNLKTPPMFQTLYGEVKMPSASDSDDQKDSSVAVHTLKAPPENSNGRLFIEFDNLQNTELRVLITVNLRPDYDLMIKDASVVSAKDPSLSFPYENVTADTLHFIGILPGLNISPGVAVKYVMNIYSVQCKIRQKIVWTSPACIVGNATTKMVVHCKCSHLSFFGSSIFVAPNTVHPINDIYLLITAKDNPLVLTLVVVLLIIYLLLMLWTVNQMKRDKLKRKVIVLEDNFPTERNPYLVVVYTAFNIGSATNANVGIMMIGSLGPSRRHILCRRDLRAFRRNADDWFLIFTPQHLGELEAIDLWHDNSGTNPDWYCKLVRIYDLTTNEQYSFVVDQWLSVWPKEYPEAVVRVSGPDNAYDWKKTVIHNILLNLQENHIWVSIILGHPRGIISKSKRLTMTYCIIMVTFLTGIMFYGVSAKMAGEDEARYVIKSREIVIAMESMVISALLTSFVATCFKKSQVVKLSGPIEDISTKVVSPSTAKTQLQDPERRTFCCVLVSKTVYKVVKPKPVLPILLGKESCRSVTNRKRWEIIGWFLSQIMIWVSGYLIILYGLKMGKVVSTLWVTMAVIRFMQGIFVSAPIKIIIFSVVLAMFGEMYNTECCECDIDAAMKNNQVVDEDQLMTMVQMRSSPHYHPLSQLKVLELREVYLQRYSFFHIIEFVVTVVFLVELLVVTGNMCGTNDFYLHSHLSQSLSDSWRPTSIELSEVVNATRLTDYLISTLIPQLFKEKWYNKHKVTLPEESLPETGWFADLNHRLVGVPRIRQIRVKPQSCLSARFFNRTKLNCLPKLTTNTEDTDYYGLGWSPITKYVNHDLLLPWLYQRQLEDGATMFGESGVPYHTGGYIVTLKDEENKCTNLISELVDMNWWNNRMRAFISELSLYNPNVDSQTAVTIITEYLSSGAFTNRIQLLIVHLSFNVISTLLFLLTVAFFNVYMIKTINREGFIETVTRFWGCYDLLLIILSDVSLFVEWVRVLKIIAAVQVFQQVGNSGFFYFSDIIFYYRLAMTLWSLMICIAPLRLAKLKFVVYTSRAVFDTLKSSRGLLASVSLVIISVICCQLFIVSFTVTPTNKSSDVDSKYYRNSDPSINNRNQKSNLFLISVLLAITLSFSNLVIQIVIIKAYQMIKRSRKYFTNFTPCFATVKNCKTFMYVFFLIESEFTMFIFYLRLPPRLLLNGT